MVNMESKMNIKDIIMWIMIIIVGLVLVGGIMYGFKLFNTATTPIIVHSVTDNIECATLVSGDGVAIDCWRTDENN